VHIEYTTNTPAATAAVEIIIAPTGIDTAAAVRVAAVTDNV
jgi:hypothetical protein